jgi:hypothetical protein
VELAPTGTSQIPHQNLNEWINHNIVQSEVEGGVYLRDLPLGAMIEVHTRNRCYHIVKRAADEAFISGHPDFCPHPVLVKVEGCNWGGSMLKRGFIGRGMRLEFRHPVYQTITTSPISEIRQVA